MKSLRLQLSFRLKLKWLLNLSRKHRKNEMFNTNCRYIVLRGNAIRDDWCEVEPIYCCFFSHRMSSTRSRGNNPQTPKHRSTAVLRVVGIDTSRTKSLIEEATPGWNDLAMSRLRVGETIIIFFVGLAPYINCVLQTRKTCLYTWFYGVNL